MKKLTLPQGSVISKVRNRVPVGVSMIKSFQIVMSNRPESTMILHVKFASILI